MRIKRYVVENIREAMSMIKRDLGENAVILSTRKIRKGGLFGIGGKVYFEITAAAEDAREEKRENVETYKLQEVLVKNRLLGDDKNSELEEIKRTVNEIKQLLVVEKVKTLPEGLSKISYGLERQGVMEGIKVKILDFLRLKYGDFDSSSPNSFQVLSEYLASFIKTNVPEIQGKVLFLGTTGVGKTTTLAKIAAKLKIEKRKKVAILTLDTYRVAATEQLKTYAEIMDIPMKIAYTPREAEYEVIALEGYDVILMDTAGRSHQNEIQMNEVRALVEAVKPNVSFLVIPMNYRTEDVEKIVEKFSVTKPTHLILTKMDETNCFGMFLNITEISKLPIAFVTNGQRVPDDIFEANPIELGRVVASEVLRYARSG